jgi:hypothetical protein
MFHFFAPFIVNLISALAIIIMTTRQRTKVQTQQTYRQVLREEVQQYKHTIITPLVLAILAVSRLIISFITNFMKSGDNSWLLIIGYFISFIPPMLTFVLFVLPSKLYVEEFHKSLLQCRQQIQKQFHRVSYVFCLICQTNQVFILQLTKLFLYKKVCLFIYE